MATLSEIKNAGLSATGKRQESTVGPDILQHFIAGLDTGPEQQEMKQKKEQEKFTFYATLRSNGVSKEEAEEKVNKVFTEKHPFLSRVFGKDKAISAFKAPSGQSMNDLKAEQMKAKTAKIQAEAATGGFNQKDARSQKIAKQRAIELIKSKQGYSRQFGGSVPLKTKADVLAALNGITGGVDTEDPEIKAALDEAFPEGAADEMVSVEVNGQRGKIPKKNLKAAMAREPGLKVING